MVMAAPFSPGRRLTGRLILASQGGARPTAAPHPHYCSCQLCHQRNSGPTIREKRVLSYAKRT
ncbi:hypothetical protein E2C01_002062 [Portunus trituberculatus]|uniref:Uncharacterized protein n=1 Tax=Portunus trituberculatus TaxID=210409 RepID=A0A5B7CJE1_PORTR|nr:hypothetical protein [Portunus trituberculatus]